MQDGAEESALCSPRVLSGPSRGLTGGKHRPRLRLGSASRRESLQSWGAASTSCFLSCFHLVWPFFAIIPHHYFWLGFFLFFFHVCFSFYFGMFLPTKNISISIFFSCATFHHCVQYRMCQWWQYVYQLNIWLLFKTKQEACGWVPCFVSHEGLVCLYLHLRAPSYGSLVDQGL